MRGFEFSRPLGLKTAILVRQQTRRRALAFAPIGETRELVLQLGVDPPRAGPCLFGQA
jgi:hypothetical protein